MFYFVIKLFVNFCIEDEKKLFELILIIIYIKFMHFRRNVKVVYIGYIILEMEFCNFLYICIGSCFFLYVIFDVL